LPLLLIPFLYAFFRSPHVDTVGTSIEPWYRYLGSQGVLLPLHLARFFWPSPMTLNWDLSPAWIFLPVVSCGWLFLTGLTWTLWKKRRSLEALGAAWMLLALLPTHSVIPVLDVHATRISFPALPGFVLLISALVMRLPRCWAIVAAALALLFFSWRTFEEIRVWKDPVRLWETNVAAAPSRWRAWVNLGVEYGERKRWGDSWNALANAERLKPGEVEVLYNQAVVATMRTDGGADRNLARRKLAEVLRVQPDHGRAQALLHQLEGDPGTN
jgi:hypothetical protein